MVGIYCCLYVAACDANESLIVNITNGSFKDKITYVNFHPENEQDIYFSTQENDLYIYSFQTKKLHKLNGIPKSGHNIISPLWSKKGSYIAYLHEKNIYIFNVHTKKINQLTDGLKVFGPMSWKNDNELFFTSRKTGILRGSIVGVNASTGNLKIVFKSKNKEHYSVQKYIKNTSEIFFSFNDNVSGHVAQDSLYRSILPPSTGSLHQVKLQDSNLTREMGGSVDVSDDGRLIMFEGSISTNRGSPSSDLFIGHANTGKVINLLSDGNDNFSPKFSPDMKKVVFLTQFKNTNEVLDIRVMEIQSIK